MVLGLSFKHDENKREVQIVNSAKLKVSRPKKYEEEN